MDCTHLDCQGKGWIRLSCSSHGSSSPDTPSSTPLTQGLNRPTTDYLNWKKPYTQKVAEAARLEEMKSEGGEYGYGYMESMSDDDMANLDRMDAAFFADVNDEVSGEGERMNQSSSVSSRSVSTYHNNRTMLPMQLKVLTNVLPY